MAVPGKVLGLQQLLIVFRQVTEDHTILEVVAFLELDGDALEAQEYVAENGAGVSCCEHREVLVAHANSKDGEELPFIVPSLHLFENLEAEIVVVGVASRVQDTVDFRELVKSGVPGLVHHERDHSGAHALYVAHIGPDDEAGVVVEARVVLQSLVDWLSKDADDW
eukprot:CAMPEP_0170500692 /NCGR_PEP_ID=MMETSP0208-20121228/35764_1 /TAXON_ID=197538 /ORGANISM="Strombidium inclinatum, Strain S3" /LENGTH=165 /DNA_ID=CAMNT_0010778845 /DNA_START=323 /DNA_END=817 /DNA_ORIENTATION=-